MRIKVLFFGFTHDVTGLREEQIELGEGENLQGLRRFYESRFPRLGELAGSLLIAVNQQIAGPLDDLHEGDEVAFMPPVSGGTDDSRYRITGEKISTSDLAKSLQAPADGAVVTFEGRRPQPFKRAKDPLSGIRSLHPDGHPQNGRNWHGSQREI